MPKAYDGQIPFDENGNQLRYAGPYGSIRESDIDWHTNDPFKGILRFLCFKRGRSAAYACFDTSMGEKRYMFLKDLEDVLTNGWFVGADLIATFIYCKRG